METIRCESFPMISMDEVAVGSYRQIASREDDDGLTSRHSPGYTAEEPKVVLKGGLGFSEYLIHILALMTTAAVVGVNFATVYAWDQEHNKANSLLQFAAKMHEIFIVGSLTSIVMDRVRKRLLGSRGLPFGLLSSGYLVSSVGFLISKGFWSAFHTDRWLSLTLAATIVLVSVVAPSSAILVIPRLNWWDVRTPFNKPLQLFLDIPIDLLYPVSLGPPDMTLYEGCDTVGYTSGCPGAAFDVLNNWAASWYNDGVMPNVSMIETTTGIQRALLYKTAVPLYDDHENWVTPNISVVTTLAQPTLEMIGLWWDYIQKNWMGTINEIKRPMFITTDSAPILSPLVQVQCASFNYSEAIKSSGLDNLAVSFPIGVLDNDTSSSTPLGWPVDPSLWNFTRPMNTTNFTWVDVSSYSDGGGVGASLGALITLPMGAFHGAKSNDTFWEYSQESTLVPCLINAKWMAAKIQYDPNSSNQIIQSITDLTTLGLGDSRNFTEDSREARGLSDTIYISPEWADLLNVAGIASTSATGESFNQTMMEALLSQFIISDINPIYSPYMPLGAKFTTFDGFSHNGDVLPAIIASVVAEGLSRQAYNLTQPGLLLGEGPNNATIKRLTQQAGWNASGIIFTNMSMAAAADAFFGTGDVNATVFDFRIKRYGYGYGYQGSAIVAFGLTVLLTYAAVTIGYILYSIINRLRGAGFSSSAWEQMGEMLALALYSGRARELQNVGGGVKAQSTWKKRVRVRERGNRLELVVGTGDFDDAQPQLDKKYQ